MNLFILDKCPSISAQMNCDKHVCKIILEAYQMLSLAHLENNSVHSFLYNAHTHRNNHVSIWVRASVDTYLWTCHHALALCSEYTVRYNKIHKLEPLVHWCTTNIPNIPKIGMLPFRQAVAEDCYRDDPVEAYHLYYVKYKRRLARWKLGNVPQWYIDLCNIEDSKTTLLSSAV